MPVPTLISELSQTANSNSPSGTESPITTDNYLRQHAAFIALSNAAMGTGTAAGFTQSGSGATVRTVQAKLRDVVSVKDFGAVADGTTDDSAAIQACIDANSYKQIYFPAGTYKIATGLTITNAGVYLQGAGIGNTVLLYTGTNGDAVTFYSTSTATTSTYLSTGGIDGIQIRRDTTATTGSGLRLRQCFLFDVGDVRIDNFPGSYLQEGGAFISIKNIRVLMAASVYTGGYVVGSWQYKFTVAPISGGLYQSPYTTQINCLQSGSAYLSEFGILIEAADGITIANNYIAAAYTSLLRFKPAYTGVNISSVSLGVGYLDAVTQSGGTAGCVEVLDGGFGSGSLINNIDISNCTTIGNTSGKGLYSTHPNIQSFTVDPSRFINCTGAEIDITSGDTSFDSWIGVPVPWTPIFTFATPGNLVQNYSVQQGDILRTKSGMVHATFYITASPTFTTASGNLRIGNLPITSLAMTARQVGLLSFSGITKAGYTQFVLRMDASASTQVEVMASGSGVAIANAVASDFTTSGFIVLSGDISYPAGELG